MSHKVPDKWLQFAPVSRVISDTFVAFKTPLDTRYNSKIPRNYRFNTDILFSSMAKLKINLGLCIDLTNTNRYYDKSCITRNNCYYEKLPLMGNGILPTRSEVQLFLNMCYDFRNRYPQFYIGVHCTHGVNRTGFLIVSYLVEILKYDVNRAIREFAEARPPGIYRQKYIDELCYRYSA